MVLGQTAVVSRRRTFQGALCALDSLQGDGGALVERLRSRQDSPGLQLGHMQGFLLRTGTEVDELDKLNIIHVTGTKGKGSTCALTERILRSYGFRTGFYSSPHLVHVRERIRVGGQPISEQLFAKSFWEAYEQLEDTKAVHRGTMPTYFQLLTLIAFHVFMQERVDVAVVEVGIGGQYDCTNIVRRPWVCGVTSLGLDHCSLLGDTMEKIAWQKAGIFKPGVPAFTVRQQPSSLRVLRNRAGQIGCPLWVCPELEQYESIVGPVSVGLAGKCQRTNASLAMQLSHSWLQRREAEDRGHSLSYSQAACRPGSPADPFQPGAPMLKGLRETEWLGRNQTLRHGPVTYHLDGAHTTASMRACVHWFRQEAARLQGDQAQGHGVRILLFNTTGERNSAALLKLLLPCQFDYALFCPNVTEEAPSSRDQPSSVMARCRDNQSSWHSLNAAGALGNQHRHLVSGSGSHSLLFPGIASALRWIGQGQQPASVLVTGSLYLVGGVLKHLEPSLDP